MMISRVALVIMCKFSIFCTFRKHNDFHFNDDVIKFGRKKATEDEMNAALELKSDEVPQSMPKGFKI